MEAHLDLTNTPLEMDIVNIDNLSPEEFTMSRREGLGASDMPTVLGMNPYKTKAELLKEKLSKELTEEEKQIALLPAVRKGHDLEPMIIDKARIVMQQQIIKPSDRYRMKEYPFIKINYDGVAGTAEQYIPVEIKVVTAKGERHYNPTKAIFDEVNGFKQMVPNPPSDGLSFQTKAQHYGLPINYYIQLQAEIMGLNAPYGFLCSLHEKDWILHLYQVWRDERVINAILIESFKFWQIVEAKRGNA